MKYRVAIITNTGEHKAENFKTREEVDDFILNNEATKFMISLNGEIIETDKGVRGK